MGKSHSDIIDGANDCSGAFVVGANSVARYRPQCFLQEAEKFGTPIVLVQINYRLGAFGFAASEDLFNESESAGNYGFVDQRNAFQWVHWRAAVR